MNFLFYDLYDGLDIIDREKELLNIILGENKEKEINLKDSNEYKKSYEIKENGGESGNNEADKEDYDLSNQIVGLIERDVNALYMRKLIEQVKIDQIDAITYSFEGNNKKKEVEFKIENRNLLIYLNIIIFKLLFIKYLIKLIFYLFLKIFILL